MIALFSRRAALAGAMPALVVASLPAVGEVPLREAPDPVFAAIEEHRVFRAKVNAFPEDEGEEYDRLMTEEDELLHALACMEPTTVAGVAALIEHVVGYEFEFNDSDAPMMQVNRSAIAALSASGEGAMSDAALRRRGFLRGLISLPLIGGSVTLIGKPTAVPITRGLMCAYKAWLTAELVRANFELYPNWPDVVSDIDRHLRDHKAAREFTKGVAPWDGPFQRPPSTRAAVVLSAVGCPLGNGP